MFFIFLFLFKTGWCLANVEKAIMGLWIELWRFFPRNAWRFVVESHENSPQTKRRASPQNCRPQFFRLLDLGRT